MSEERPPIDVTDEVTAQMRAFSALVDARDAYEHRCAEALARGDLRYGAVREARNRLRAAEAAYKDAERVSTAAQDAAAAEAISAGVDQLDLFDGLP